MALQVIGCRQLQLHTENKQLARMYFAGVNPQEFSRMRIQDIELMSVSSLCDELMRCLDGGKHKKTMGQSIAFSDLFYIVAGLLLVFNTQVSFLYDQVLRQAHCTKEYVQKSHSITIWQKPVIHALPKKRKSKKLDNSDEVVPKKRAKVAEVEFDWQSLNSSVNETVDDESTIHTLQTSKVMNRDQISIREVVTEPQLDALTQFHEFSAAENADTQNFLEIRKLVSTGRSIVRIIQNEDFTPVVAGDNGKSLDDDDDDDDGGFYPPMVSQRTSPLPDIERCHDESDANIPDQDIEMGDINVKVPGRQSSNESSLPSLPSQLPRQTPSTAGKKRRRIVFDDVLQIRLTLDDPNTARRLSRCEDPRLDCATNVHIMSELKMQFFNKPAHHEFRRLQPRYTKESDVLMNGMRRVMRRKRKEENDRKMVEDFLNLIDREPEEELRLEEQSAQRSKRDQAATRRSSLNVSIERPQPCDHRVPQSSELCEIELESRDESMYHSDDDVPMPESFDEPEPTVEFETSIERVELNLPSLSQPPVVALEHEPSLPSLNQSPIVERQVRSETKTQNYHLESADIPRNVLRVLKPFVTDNSTNQTCDSGSGSLALFLLNNQKNRQKWGLKGVLTNLFRLWHKDTYPIGMKELLHPHKQKIGAALAFYSIMELNSPRIGLIVIEKCDVSNAVHNIAMSEKLINLVMKRN